jgi:hypothetical protein
MPDTSNRLVTLYPTFEEQIKAGQAKGFTDAQIETRIHGIIKGLTDEGYDQQDILKFIQPAAREDYATPNTLEGAKRWVSQALSGSASSQTGRGAPSQAIGEFGKGVTRGASLGYLGQDLPPAATPTEQLASAAGEFAGGAVPFVKGFKLAKAGLEMLPGAGPVAGFVKSYLSALGTGTAMSAGASGAEKTPSGPGAPEGSGGRSQAAINTLTDPYMQLGAVGGGVIGAAQAMRPAIRSSDPMSRAAEGMTAILDKASQDKSQEAPPVKETPKVRQAVQEAAVVDQWMRLPDSKLLEQSYHDTVYGNKTPGLETAIEERAKRSQAFSQAMASNLLDAGAERDRIKGVTPEGDRTRGTAASKTSVEVLKKMQSEGLEADLSEFGPNDLSAAASAVSAKMQSLEASKRTPKMDELHDRLQQASSRITQELTDRTSKSGPIASASEPSASPSPSSELTVDDVRAADRVQHRGTSIENGQISHRLSLFSRYPGDEYLKLGDTTVPDAEFQKLDMSDKLFVDPPSKVISEAPKSPAEPMSLGERASKLFKPGDMVSAPRIERALRVSSDTAMKLADQVRAARGEPPSLESTVGAQTYEGETGQPNVDRAIQGFQAKRDQMLQAGYKDTSKFVKLYQRAIDELTTTGKISEGLRKEFGITPRKAKPTPAEPAPVAAEAPSEVPLVPEPTSLAPTADLPPSTTLLEHETASPELKAPEPGITKPVMEGSAVAAPQEGTHQVLVYKGDKLYRQYRSSDQQTATDLKGMVDAFLEAKGLTEDYTTRLQELPKTSLAEPREGKSRRLVSTGLGKERQTREVPMGLDVEQALLRKKYGRELTADEVRMEEEQANPAPVYSTKAVEALADQKGLVVNFNTQTGQGLNIEFMGDSGSQFATKDLKAATEYLMQLPDKASRASLDKAVRGEPLSQQDRLELDKYSSEQHKLETRVSDAPVLEDEPPSKGEPEMPNISGGAGGAPLTTIDKLNLVAQAKKMTPNEATNFVDHTSKLFQEYPGLEAWWLSEMDTPGGKLAFLNPIDYAAMPQFSSNPGIRTITKDAAFLHEIPKFSEMRQWTDYYNTHWGDLTEAQQRETWQVMAKRKNLADVTDAKTVQAVEAAKAFVKDIGSRLGIGPEWYKYLSGLIDKQKLYEGYRQLITGYDHFEDLPRDTQMRLGGSENRFEMVKRAFDKNTSYEDLPKDVKRAFNKDLVQWFTDTQYDQLPKQITDIVPKEMWETFSMSGGFPLVENWNATFRKIMPAIMGHIYTEPLVDKWKPVIDSLPGNATGVTTKAYLTKWLALTQGSSERSGLSLAFDGLTSKVENSWGKALSDPDFLGRLATRTGLATYQSTLGLALDTSVVNQFQHLNTWAAGGRIAKGVAGYLARSDISKLYREMPEGVGILEEMAYHQLQGSELGGVGLPKVLERFGISQDTLKRWDAWITPKVMHPMHVSENILRGTAMLAGLEDAATMGLDMQTALRLGVGRASQVVPNLSLTAGHLHALDLVAQTQFAYEKVFQSPYLQGPLTKLSTIFWSYPTKQLQFLSNGMGQAIADTVRQPGYSEISRLARYTGLLGLFTLGPWAGVKVGLNLDNIFGSGLFPQLVSIPLQVAGTMYQAVLGRQPVAPKDMQQMWKNLVYMLGVPGGRYTGKAWDAANASADGYERSALGQRTFDTSTFGEMTRMLGLEYGRSYEQRAMARTIMETEVKLNSEKQTAMGKAIYGSLMTGFQPDLSAVEKFNEKWGTMYPGTQITGDELAHFAQQGAKSSVERLGSPTLRQGIKNEYGYQP